MQHVSPEECRAASVALGRRFIDIETSSVTTELAVFDLEMSRTRNEK